MLRLWIILTAICGVSLIAASCAETGTALVTAEAEQAAVQAATQATQAATEAATQMEEALNQGQPIQLPSPDGGKTMIIETPDAYIVIKGDSKVVIMKSAIHRYGYPSDDNPENGK